MPLDGLMPAAMEGAGQLVLPPGLPAGQAIAPNGTAEDGATDFRQGPIAGQPAADVTEGEGVASVTIGYHHHRHREVVAGAQL
jgi:hypothetical protein